MSLCESESVASARIRGKTTVGLARCRSFDAGNDFRSKTEESREDLLFLRDRDADEFNRADLEALFRVS